MSKDKPDFFDAGALAESHLTPEERAAVARYLKAANDLTSQTTGYLTPEADDQITWQAARIEPEGFDAMNKFASLLERYRMAGRDG